MTVKRVKDPGAGASFEVPETTPARSLEEWTATPPADSDGGGYQKQVRQAAEALSYGADRTQPKGDPNAPPPSGGGDIFDRRGAGLSGT